VRAVVLLDLSRQLSRAGIRRLAVVIDPGKDVAALRMAKSEKPMAKAYWVATYRSIKNPDALAAYAKLAGPALQEAGGRFVARGMPTKAFELGVMERVVIIEFDSAEAAVTAYNSPAYAAAHKLLEGAVERDIRIVEAAA
jgi:uncharacterized protein (DUF1330 family)